MSRLNINIMEVHPFPDSPSIQFRAFPELVLDERVSAETLRMCRVDPRRVIADAVKRQILDSIFGRAKHALSVAQDYFDARYPEEDHDTYEVRSRIGQALAEIREFEGSVLVGFDPITNPYFYAAEAEECRREARELRNEAARVRRICVTAQSRLKYRRARGVKSLCRQILEGKPR